MQSTTNLPIHKPKKIIIFMGVAGCGKTTLSKAYAQHLSNIYQTKIPVYEGDTFHSPSNLAKLSMGTPLSDSDRWPWLTSLASTLASTQDPVVVATCSALKQTYRQLLATTLSIPGVMNLAFVYLNVPLPDLHNRLQARLDHFMNPSLLDSQLACLQDPMLDSPNHLYSVFQVVYSGQHTNDVDTVHQLLHNWLGCL